MTVLPTDSSGRTPHSAVEIAERIELAEHVVPAPVGIVLTAADTGTGGIRASVINGECFGNDIEWFDDGKAEKTVTVTTDPKTGLPMLTYPLGDSGLVAEYRGLEADGVTWWRYAHEVDPNEYREHCLRVVRTL